MDDKFDISILFYIFITLILIHIIGFWGLLFVFFIIYKILK